MMTTVLDSVRNSVFVLPPLFWRTWDGRCARTRRSRVGHVTRRWRPWERKAPALRSRARANPGTRRPRLERNNALCAARPFTLLPCLLRQHRDACSLLLPVRAKGGLARGPHVHGEYTPSDIFSLRLAGLFKKFLCGS